MKPCHAHFTIMPRVLITVPDKQGQPYRFKIDRKVVKIGRGSQNDIVVDSASVSTKHAEMHRIEGGYELRDNGSTNGTKLNGDRMEAIELLDGMHVRLGDVSFDFQLTEEEKAVLDEELPTERRGRLPKIEEKRKKPMNRPAPAVVHESSGGFVMVLGFLVLAAGAFFIGLSLRHQKETGISLLDAMQGKAPVVEETRGADRAAAPEEPN